MAQELKFPGGPPLGVDHLNARQVSVQNRQSCIEDLVVQDLHPGGCYQLRSDLLKGFQLLLVDLLILPEELGGIFKLPSSLFYAQS